MLIQCLQHDPYRPGAAVVSSMPWAQVLSGTPKYEASTPTQEQQVLVSLPRRWEELFRMLGSDNDPQHLQLLVLSLLEMFERQHE